MSSPVLFVNASSHLYCDWYIWDLTENQMYKSNKINPFWTEQWLFLSEYQIQKNDPFGIQTATQPGKKFKSCLQFLSEGIFKQHTEVLILVLVSISLQPFRTLERRVWTVFNFRPTFSNSLIMGRSCSDCSFIKEGAYADCNKSSPWCSFYFLWRFEVQMHRLSLKIFTIV